MFGIYFEGGPNRNYRSIGSKLWEEGSRTMPRLWACARKRMVMPKREERREEEVWEGEDKSEVLFFTQCLLDIYGEFGQAI